MSKRMNTLSAGRPSARTGRTTPATLASLANASSMKRVNFELSEEQHSKLKIHAARKGKSIKALLTDFVEGLPCGE